MYVEGVDAVGALGPTAVTRAGKNCNIQLRAPFCSLAQAVIFSPTTSIVAGFARSARVALSLHSLWRIHSAVIASLVLLQRHASRRNDVYNILWAVVFGFATLNI